MAAQLLRFRQHPSGGFRLVVWTDDTKTGADGQPDPDSLRVFDYAAPPAGMTQAAYVAMIRRETKLLVQHELAADDPGAVVAGEGTEL